MFGNLLRMITGSTKAAVPIAEAASKGGIRGWASTSIGKTLGAGINIGFIGMSVFTTGKEYGYGAGLAEGLMYATTGPLGHAVFVGSLVKGVGDAAEEHQKGRTKSSFTRGFQDPYGNAATMRQRSQYNLNRGRSSLGSEAYLMH